MPPLAALFIVCVIDVLGFGLMVPLVPYMADRFGASPEVITPLLGSYSLFQLISSPLWGRLSDRYGRRPILVSSMLGACISYLLLGFAQNLWWLLASRVLGGLMAGNLATMLAYAADVSAPKDRARALGSVGAAIGVGFMLGPALGGVLAGEKLGAASFLRPALVAALLALFALVLVVLLLRESHGREQRARHRAAGPRLNSWQLLRDKPGLRWLALAVLLVTFSQSTLDSIFAIWAMNRYHVGPRSIGFALFALALVAVVMQGGLMRRLVPRFGEYRLAYAGIASFVGGLTLVAVGTTMPVTIAGLVLVGFGVGAFGPSGSALVSRQASASIRGAVMGVYQGSVSLARVVGPLLSGLIYSRFGHNAPFLVGGLITLQATWCVAAARQHPGTDSEGG